jgi:hypothetical protein
MTRGSPEHNFWYSGRGILQLAMPVRATGTNRVLDLRNGLCLHNNGE